MMAIDRPIDGLETLPMQVKSQGEMRDDRYRTTVSCFGTAAVPGDGGIASLVDGGSSRLHASLVSMSSGSRSSNKR
jgi:hypothetical protein